MPIDPDDAAIWSLYEDAVRATCHKRAHSYEDAEDAVQKTFIAFVTRTDRTLRNPRAWLTMVAARTTISAYRRQHRSEELPETLVGREPDPQVAAAGADWVRAVLHRLLPRDREILVRLYLEGWAPADLAGRMGVTRAHLDVLASRARQRARAIADDLGRGLGGLVPGVVRRGWRRVLQGLGRLGRSHVFQHLVEPLSAVPAVVEAIVLATLALASGSALAPHPATAAAGVRATPPSASVLADDLPRPVQRNAAPDPGRLVDVSGPVGSGLSTGPGGDPVPAPGLPHGGTSGLAASLLPGLQPVTETDASFSALTPSPAYASDGTVFAVGRLVPCLTTCQVLFVSHDRGATWQHLTATGFTGERLLLPATYPQTPVLFALGTAGLQRSDDGGATFRPAVPGSFPAAVLPTAPAVDPEVLIGTMPLLVYHGGSGAVTPGPMLPATVVSVDDVGALPSGRVIVAVRELPPGSTQRVAALLSCDPGMACVTAATYSDGAPLSLSVAPAPASRPGVLAWALNTLHVSLDAGQTYSTLPLLSVNFIAFGVPMGEVSTSGTVYLVARPSTLAGMVLLVSTDGGRSFTPAADAGLPSDMQLSTMLPLPDERLLGALALSDGHGFGLRCSHDGGASWQTSC